MLKDTLWINIYFSYKKEAAGFTSVLQWVLQVCCTCVRGDLRVCNPLVERGEGYKRKLFALISFVPQAIRMYLHLPYFPINSSPCFSGAVAECATYGCVTPK